MRESVLRRRAIIPHITSTISRLLHRLGQHPHRDDTIQAACPKYVATTAPMMSKMVV